MSSDALILAEMKAVKPAITLHINEIWKIRRRLLVLTHNKFIDDIAMRCSADMKTRTSEFSDKGAKSVAKSSVVWHIRGNRTSNSDRQLSHYLTFKELGERIKKRDTDIDEANQEFVAELEKCSPEPDLSTVIDLVKEHHKAIKRLTQRSTLEVEKLTEKIVADFEPSMLNSWMEYRGDIQIRLSTGLYEDINKASTKLAEDMVTEDLLPTIVQLITGRKAEVKRPSFILPHEENMKRIRATISKIEQTLQPAANLSCYPVTFPIRPATDLCGALSVVVAEALNFVLTTEKASPQSDPETLASEIYSLSVLAAKESAKLNESDEKPLNSEDLEGESVEVEGLRLVGRPRTRELLRRIAQIRYHSNPLTTENSNEDFFKETGGALIDCMKNCVPGLVGYLLAQVATPPLPEPTLVELTEQLEKSKGELLGALSKLQGARR
ncbi:hypothetical protein DFH09DRAFT_1091116 [Mycena vulgaris]|nr:hypothetical protein DFH09DRAFT_1091116 [Mycena vulgaris]